jgi:hypothetical protein
MQLLSGTRQEHAEKLARRWHNKRENRSSFVQTQPAQDCAQAEAHPNRAKMKLLKFSCANFSQLVAKLLTAKIIIGRTFVSVKSLIRGHSPALASPAPPLRTDGAHHIGLIIAQGSDGLRWSSADLNQQVENRSPAER